MGMIKKKTSKKHAEFSNLRENSYVGLLCGKSHYGCLGVKNYVDMANIFLMTFFMLNTYVHESIGIFSC